MKGLLNLILPLFVLTIFLTGCDKDSEVISEDYFAGEITERDGHGHSGVFGNNRCFEVQFPLTIEFPDGTETTVQNRDELIQAFSDWKAQNPDVQGRLTYVYPFSVLFSDSTSMSVTSDDDWAQVRNVCKELRPQTLGNPEDRCFQIVYPVNVLWPDGSLHSAANKKEVQLLYRQWFGLNPDSKQRPSVAYPFDVRLRNGEIVGINSAQEFQDLRESCD